MGNRLIFLPCCICLALILAGGSASAFEDPEAASIVRSMRDARRVGRTPSNRERYLRVNYSPERLANEFGIQPAGR